MKRIDKFNDEELQDICNRCKSYRELAMALGYSGNSGSVADTIKRELDRRKIILPNYIGYGWNKGLTKETDVRVAQIGKTLRDGYSSGNILPSFLGKRHTEQTKEKMADIARDNAVNHKNGWKSGDNRVNNCYEEMVANILTTNNVDFKQEFLLSRRDFEYQFKDTNAPYFRFDFLIDNVIDLEIDGSVHDTDIAQKHDAIRDMIVKSCGYKVYRISTTDDVNILINELNKFLSIYRMDAI